MKLVGDIEVRSALEWIAVPVDVARNVLVRFATQLSILELAATEDNLVVAPALEEELFDGSATRACYIATV